MTCSFLPETLPLKQQICFETIRYKEISWKSVQFRPTNTGPVGRNWTDCYNWGEKLHSTQWHFISVTSLYTSKLLKLLIFIEYYIIDYRTPMLWKQVKDVVAAPAVWQLANSIRRYWHITFVGWRGAIEIVLDSITCAPLQSVMVCAVKV